MGKIGSSHCSFEIRAPGYRSHIENVAFTLYAMDQERNEELSMAINILASYPEQCWDEDFQNEVFVACGIDSLTVTEYEFILNTISEILED
jgi:hypothetical protein